MQQCAPIRCVTSLSHVLLLLQEMSEDLKAAQHLRQAAEKELLNLKQKAAEVAGKLELTGRLLQVYIHVGSSPTLMDGSSVCADEF